MFPVQFLSYVASVVSFVWSNKICALFILDSFITSVMAKDAKILVFGGNGFIGSECVKLLLKDGHKVTVVNRGNSYWDYDTLVKPHVSEILCDRNQGLAKCSFNSERPKAFDFVVDFSAFKSNVIEDALHHLKRKIGTYIYISSDSVYEVSKVSENKRSKESDAVRPEDPVERLELNRRDSYGHNKLAGEELLEEKFASSGIPFVIFRLPDVIGPRDRTYRWWTYQTWMQVYSSSGKPLVLPRSAVSLVTSYVYVKDVSRIISKTVQEIYHGNHGIHFERFNLAFPEEYSLRKLLDSMQGALGVKGVEYRYEDETYHLFPSVTRGPVNISKSTEMLQWMATPWQEAVQETVDFFKDALYRFPDERHSMMMVLSNLVGEDFDSVQQKVEHYLKFQDTHSSDKSDVKYESHNEL